MKLGNIAKIENDTTLTYKQKFEKMIEVDKTIFQNAEKLNNDLCLFFGWNIDKDINNIDEGNVDKILKKYKLIRECDWYNTNESLTEGICDELMTNKTKRTCIKHIQSMFELRAKNLGINTKNLNKEFDKIIDKMFSTWQAKIFGYISNSYIEKIDKIFENYIELIDTRETEFKANLYHKPATDEEISKYLDEAEKERDICNYSGSSLVREFNERKEMFKDCHITDEGTTINGKIDYPTIQIGATCVYHGSINALRHSKKGLDKVNRLLRLKKDYLYFSLPEANRNNVHFDNALKVSGSQYFSTIASFGDGDVAALIMGLDSYDSHDHGTTFLDFAQIHRGFEVLSGEKAQVFTPDEKIPKGVGLTKFDYFKICHNFKSNNNYETMYNNLKEILDKDKGAAVIDLKIFGQSSFGEMVNNPADNKIIENEKPFMSSNHVYSVIKLTDDYAYLQESNNPKYYIRITKEQFLNSLLNVATWQFD